MTFFEAFENVKKSMKTAKADKIDGHLAIQVNLNDPDASGICYIEVKDHTRYVEPYDYYDRDAIIHISSNNLVKIMTGKLGFEKALEDKLLVIEGNLERAAELKKLIKKPATRKTAVKKTATEPEKKPAAKKAPAKKSEVSAEEKAAPAKKTTTTKKAPAKKTATKK